MSIHVRNSITLGVLLISTPAISHHNPNVHFDRNQEVEIYGTLTEVKWRSPHIQLIVVVEDDGDVLLRHEDLKVVRRIHIGSVPTGTPNPFGIAVGRWEGDALIVTTTDINFPWFDQEGIPQSKDLELVERFSVSDDNRYLLYSVTASDSAIFTQPVTLEKRWLSVPLRRGIR